MRLKNKEGVWKSDDLWIFTRKGNDTVIANNSTTKVLEATSDGKVIQEILVEGKPDQLWKKGELDGGYFTLENSEVPKVLIAISEKILEIKGNMTMR